jgi:hypothetical protein
VHVGFHARVVASILNTRARGCRDEPNRFHLSVSDLKRCDPWFLATLYTGHRLGITDDSPPLDVTLGQSKPACGPTGTHGQDETPLVRWTAEFVMTDSDYQAKYHGVLLI